MLGLVQLFQNGSLLFPATWFWVGVPDVSILYCPQHVRSQNVYIWGRPPSPDLSCFQEHSSFSSPPLIPNNLEILRICVQHGEKGLEGYDWLAEPRKHGVCERMTGISGNVALFNDCWVEHD